MMRVSIIERALNKCFLMLAKMDDMEMYNLYYMYEIASYTCKWLSLLIFMLGGDTELFPQWDKANIFTCASFFIWLKLTRTRSSFMLSPYHHGDVSFLTQSQPRQQLLSHLNCQSRKEVRPKRGTEQHINPMGSYSLCAILELYGASSSPFLLLSYYCCLRLRRRLCS